MPFFKKNNAPTNDDLGALMVKAQAGDQRAYHILLEAAEKKVKSYLAKRLKDQDALEDLTQICLMALHKSRHTYQAGEPFENWLFGIARYKHMDYLRHYYKKNENENVNSFIIETFGGDETNNKAREASHDLGKLLDNLPAKQQKIIRLLKVQGHSIADVATIMDMSESNVKVTAHRAMKDLENIAKAEQRKA